MKLRDSLIVGMLALMPLTAIADTVVKSGSFAKESEGISGSVQIVKLDSGNFVIRMGKDFVSATTAPDVTLGLGNNGYIEASNLGPLKAKAGALDYALPAKFDPAKVNQVIIWCRTFHVSLGEARLN